MKVLVACEESQTVCCEMRKLGHEAYSADILKPSGGHPEWHVLGDVLPIINGNCEFTTMDGASHRIEGKWDLLIAHPPCTFLSNAGACRLYPHKGELDINRYNKGLKAKEFFMQFLNADCDRIAVENPVHCKIFATPPHSQEIQPYQFGHPYSKKTRLWLRGLQPLVPTKILTEYSPFLPAGTSRKDKTKYGAKQCAHNSFDRSKTFSGIAKAMAEQWAGKAI